MNTDTMRLKTGANLTNSVEFGLTLTNMVGRSVCAEVFHSGRPGWINKRLKRRNYTMIMKPDMESWKDMRFGMFIHWGLYALMGRGEWVMYTLPW